MTESYNQQAEEKLPELKRALEEKDRMLLRMEYWVAFPAMATAIVLVLVASFAEMPPWLKILLIAFGVVMIIAVACVAVRIEQKAGYYECRHCRHRYVPTYWQVNLAVHSGRTRYMKCPKCGKRSWQKKVLTKEDLFQPVRAESR